MGANSEKTCPKCRSRQMDAWDELTGEQKFLVERLPGNVDFTSDERKKHRFCTRCWFEDPATYEGGVAEGRGGSFC